MKIHIIMHESFESPAAIEEWGCSKNHEISYTRLYRGDALPNDAKGFDFLVIMGGPQSPATTIEECSHFNAKAEIKLIAQAVKAEKLVLGVCLGAQLIGEALGAKFDHSPHREIGVFEVNLTPEAKDDPIFSKFPKSFLVGHWHGDMPGLTQESTLLAYSQGCPRQIVRYTPKVYGFQCHFEFTKKAIEDMIQNCGHELEAGKNASYIQSAEVLREQDYQGINQLLYNFLNCLEEACKISYA